MAQIDLSFGSTNMLPALEILSSDTDGITLNSFSTGCGPPSDGLTLSSGGTEYLIADRGTVEIPEGIGLWVKHHIKMADEGWVGLEFNAGRIEFHNEGRDLILLRDCNVGIGTEFDPDGLPEVRPDGIFEVRGTDDQDDRRKIEPRKYWKMVFNMVEEKQVKKGVK